MDFILELIFGLFFEVPMELAMGSKRLKTWVKTVLYLIMGLLVDLMFVISACVSWFTEADSTGTVIMAVLGAAWIIFVIWTAVYGHKHKWKKYS